MTSEKEQEYREALGIWLKEHPGKNINDIPQKEEVLLPSGKRIKLGSRIVNMKSVLKGTHKGILTQDQYDYWIKKHGLKVQKTKSLEEREQEYREALELWLKTHPGKTINDVPQHEIISLPSGTIVFIGRKISNMRNILKGNLNGNINKSQKEYWILKQGLSTENQRDKLNNLREQEYREALELWLEKHPEETINDISVTTKVKIANGKKIALGARIATIKDVLRGTQNGTIDEEKYTYWIEEKKLQWEKPKEKIYRTKREKKIHQMLLKKETIEDPTVTSFLQEFQISFETFNNSFEQTKGNRVPQVQVQKKENETLRRYCVRNGYSYEMAMRMLKFHKLFPNDSFLSNFYRSMLSNTRENPKKRFFWIYELYGEYLPFILTSMHFDKDHILEKMNKEVLPLEKAIQKELFRMQTNENQNLEFEELYEYLMTNLIEMKESTGNNSLPKIYESIKEFQLTKEEYDTFFRFAFQFFETMGQYQDLKSLWEKNKRKTKKVFVKNGK